MNSLRKGRYDILRQPINELALGRRGCLSVHIRCLHEKAFVKPQGMITNGQSSSFGMTMVSEPITSNGHTGLAVATAELDRSASARV